MKSKIHKAEKGVRRTITLEIRDVTDCPRCKGKGDLGSFTDDYGSYQRIQCPGSCFLGMIIYTRNLDVRENKNGTFSIAEQ